MSANRPLGFLVTLVAALSIAQAACSDPQARKQQYVASGDGYVAEGKLPEAIIQYENAVQQVPTAGDVRVKLADAYISAGAPANALQEYVRAADLLPEDSSVHLKTGGLLLLAGRFDDAKLWAERVLAREPRNIEAQMLLANSLAGLNDLDGALAQIEEAIALDPGRGETYSNLGYIELTKGGKDAAERAFKKAVDLDPKSPQARLALANFYWAGSRWDAAEEELKKAVEFGPENAMAYRTLASFYVATRRAPEAEPHLKKVLEIAKDGSAALTLADFYIGQNKEAAARAVLEPLTKTLDAAPAQVRLASLDHKGGQKEAAYKGLDAILERDKTNLDALLVKSQLLLTDGRLDEALVGVTLAVQQHAESAAALFILGRVQAARHQRDEAIASFDAVLRLNPRAAGAKLALAQLHLSSGKGSVSLGLAQDVRSSDPDNIEARYTIIRGLLAQRDIARAQQEMDLLLKQAPDSPSVLVLAGQIKMLKQDRTGAREMFERALKNDPNSTEALAPLVGLDLEAKRPAEARARIDQRLKASPSDPAVLMVAARAYAAMGDQKQAEGFLRSVIRADPTYLDAYNMLVGLYMRQQRTGEALVELEELSKRQSRPVGVLTMAGVILEAQGKTTEAQERYTRALELDPETPVAANNLAWGYAQTEDKLDLAMELALRAKAKIPDQPEVNDTVGWVHYRKGQAADAIPYFQKSIAANPGQPIYHYHLGLAYQKIGDVGAARDALNRALQIKSDFAGADDARRILATLPAAGGSRP